MVRLVIYLLAVLLIASGLAWLADRPGTLQIFWQGYDIETSVFRAAVLLAGVIAMAIFLWSVVRTVWNSPAILGDRIVRRRQKRGLEALSSGLIAVGAGDKTLATRYALQARKTLPHEPLTHLLRAQAAQLSGDRATTRRIYEAMLQSPETEQLGLRGLYLEAEREGETVAAVQFAERALKANPRLEWSAGSLFEMQCRQKDWAGALESLTAAKRNGAMAKGSVDRKRAVLLTALAQDNEENDPDKSLAYALEAHHLAPDLVPAACVAGRILASRGNTAKAAKVLQKTWSRTPHPDIAEVYAFARVGDSTHDRLDRVRQLAALSPQSIESPIAVAKTAIDARLYSAALNALEPLIPDRMTQRVATLLAQAEAGATGDKGKVREWLARAAHAARDPVWIADGVISSRWEPISPVDGHLDAFAWRVPTELTDQAGKALDASRIEALLAIEAPAGESDDTNREPTLAGSAAPDDIIDAEAVTVVPEQITTPAVETPAAKTEAQKTSATPTDVAEPPPQMAVNVSAEAVTPPTVTAPQGAVSIAKPQPQREPTIFVTPRAPDDPGLDAGEEDVVTPLPRRPYQAAN